MPSIKKNLGWNIFLTVSGYLFPLLTFPYVTRVLGADNLGLANFALSVVDYALIFANLGFSAIGCKYISQYNSDTEKRNKIFGSLVSLHIILSCIIIAVYTSCVFLIDQLYENRILYLVGIAKIVSNVFLIEWLFQGMQDFRYVTLRTLIIRSLYVIAIFAMVRHKEDYDVFFYITIAQVVVNAVVNWNYSRKYVHFTFSFKGIRQFIFPVFSMGINYILLSFYVTFNNIILGMCCDDASVGYYVTATRLYAILISLITAYNGVLFPHLNSLFGKGEMDEFKKYIRESFSLVLLMAIPIIVGGVILAPEIVRLIAGPGYERAVLPFQIILFQVLFVGIAQTLENQILLSLKKFKDILICTSVSISFAAVILFALVPTYAEVASAYAVAIPHLIEVILLYYYARRAIDIKFPVAEFFKNLLSCVPIAVICLYVRQLPLAFYWILIICCGSSAIYYFVMQYFVLNNSLLHSQIDQHIPGLLMKHKE